jgi:hypothetical protein
MNIDLVPKENIEIYNYIYRIEVGLRELIIEQLSAIEGPRWYKKRLPPDVLKKYCDGINEERKIKWTQLIPHHPIYYTDLDDLKKTIERKDNWENVFKGIFGSQKDILNNVFSEIECIRNKVAHNRKASKKDIAIVKTAYLKLSEIIGSIEFRTLVLRCTCAYDIFEQLRILQKESERVFNMCKEYKPIDNLDRWKSISNQWWFDESYLCLNINAIIDFFKTIEEYITLPRTRGSGYKIEFWVNNSIIIDKYKKAEIEFLNIIDNRR